MTLDKFNDTLKDVSEFFDAAQFNLFIGRDNIVLSVFYNDRNMCNIKFDKDFYVISDKKCQSLACDISNPRVSYKDNKMTVAEESAIKSILKMFK